MLKVFKVFYKKELIGNFLTFDKTETLKVSKEVYVTIKGIYNKKALNSTDFSIKEVY